jgi:hypothetical protein
MAAPGALNEPVARKFRLALPRGTGLIWVLIGLCILATVLSPSFLNPVNVR